ncbi:MULTISPECIES: helix-turn-helix domain-containing protein [unclassified Streptomyces]|uniref:helix-turn-helix domain-containing protein n=1 Tax=unclassified Streptomyces TaxID=2593676 RepID=UPI0037F87B65
MPPALVRHLPANEGDAPLPRLYRPEEIAQALGCSAWWVKDRARRRLIPHTRVGRSYRFTAPHLAEIIRLHEERPKRFISAAPADPAVTGPPAARTRSTQSSRPTTAATTARLRARPPRRTQYEPVV